MGLKVWHGLWKSQECWNELKKNFKETHPDSLDSFIPLKLAADLIAEPVSYIINLRKG